MDAWDLVSSFEFYLFTLELRSSGKLFSSRVSLIAGVDTGATKPHLAVAECVPKCCAAFGRDHPHLAHC